MYKFHKCEWDESSKEGHIFCWICNNEIPYTNMNEDKIEQGEIVWVGALDDDNFYTPVSCEFGMLYSGENRLPIFPTKEKCQVWCDEQPKEMNYEEDYELTDKLLDELNSRGGFDGWWGNLDEEIQLEIKTTLASIIRKHED